MEGMQWCHWWHHQHHGKPVALVMVSHDQNYQVAPNFKYLYLRNRMVPWWCQWCNLMLTPMPMEWCDTNNDTTVVTCSKESCCTSFWLSWCKELCVAIDDAVSIMWCQCWCHGIKWPKVPYWALFQLFWPKESSDAINNAISIMCCRCNCNGVTWPKKSCCPSLWSSWPKECNIAFHDAVSIMR